MALDAFAGKSALIRLHDGRLYDILHPDPGLITLETIAIGLSNLCRYSGQLPRGRFYSVAEHSWHVSMRLPHALRLHGVLHDAPEALGLVDVVGPLKAHLPVYREVERLNLIAVAEAFGIDVSLFAMPILAEVDKRMGLTERLAFRAGSGSERSEEQQPFVGESFGLLLPDDARMAFYAYTADLLAARGLRCP